MGTMKPVFPDPGKTIFLMQITRSHIKEGEQKAGTGPRLASVSTIRKQAVLMASESAQQAQDMPQDMLCLATVGQDFDGSPEACSLLNGLLGLLRVGRPAVKGHYWVYRIFLGC